MPADYSSEGKLSLFPYDPRYRPIAPPEVGIFDAPTTQICLNVEWVGHIEGTLDRLLWRDAWQGSFETQEWAIAQIRKLLIQFMQRNPCGDEDMPFKLRQNPTNRCQLQQSLDGGVTWELAFDYSLCQPAPSPLLEYNFQQTITNQFYQWSQTTNNTEINQYAPTETFTGSEGEDENRINARKLALCYATKIYVDGYCEAIKQINESAATWSNLAALALGVGAAVITILSSGATLPLWLALGAGLTQLGTEAYASLTDAVLDDLSAREAVACLMYLTLKDLEPTAENFATAVNSGTLSVNAELIRATLAVDISNETGLENQFNAFINLLGDSLRPAELGLITDCPCEAPEEQEEITDFATGENVEKWTVVAGTIVPGSYIENALDSFYPPGNTYQVINLTRTVPAGSILTYAKIEGTYAAGTLDATGDSTFALAWGAFSANEIIPDVPVMPVELPGLSEAGGAVELQLMCGASLTSATNPGGTARITRITLRWTGDAL